MTTKRRSCVTALAPVFISLVIICFLSSCASRPETVRLHEEEHLPLHQVAYLVGDREDLMLHSVDGKESPSGRKGFGSSWDGTYHLEVLPGEHTLTVSLDFRTTDPDMSNRFSYHEVYYEISSLENVDVRLRVESGHIYLLTSEWDFDSQKWFVVIVDQTREETVLKEGPYLFKSFQVGDFFESPGPAFRPW